ncbi:MAG TPA: 2-oxoglutarate dehydrogenase complex dihydrolipoyllysine-residue succinyltransferase [Nevskiales bacterium]|nr:2-oxoglutarate dehydrogenase complex dihydrolipoyllysine-residue succinyltransferase [Nevskiales bacterium]
MSIEVKVPQLPESVAEATVGVWHKKPGDKIDRDENLVDLETDKVMLEVPAISDGVLAQVLKQEGETVKSGDVIALIEQGSAMQVKPKTPEAETPKPAAKTDGKPAPTPGPAARKLLAEANLASSDVVGSGKGGRVTKGDVLEHAARPAAAPQAQPSTPPAYTAGRIEQRVAMTRIRARIAERLKEAQNTAAMLTTFNEVDLHAVGELRKQYKDLFEKQHGARLGYMSFFVRASVEALKRFPVVNASIDGNDIVYHGYYDIGIAVSSPRGLVVPILRDADQLGMAEIEKKIAEFGQKAKDNKLTLEELQGGTFSITNGGVFGSMLSTPILNPPQSAILGMHGITERPMVVNGEIKVRPMMYLALSYDHRLIDGREAVLFLRTIKEVLEDPARLLLQV